MLKEHKKMYKSGKSWVVASLAVAALGIFSMQTGVAADSTVVDATPQSLATTATNAQQVQSAQEAVNQKQTQVDQLQQKLQISQDNLSKDQQTLQDAQAMAGGQDQAAALQNARDKVNQDQDAVKNSQQTLHQAQGQLPANATQLKDNLTNAENEYNKYNVIGFFNYLKTKYAGNAQLVQDANTAIQMLEGKTVTINGHQLVKAPWYDKSIKGKLFSIGDVYNPDKFAATNFERILENYVDLYQGDPLSWQSQRSKFLKKYAKDQPKGITAVNQSKLSLSAMAAAMLDSQNTSVHHNDTSSYYGNAFMAAVNLKGDNTDFTIESMLDALSLNKDNDGRRSLSDILQSEDSIKKATIENSFNGRKVAGVTISPAQSGYSESQYQYALHTVDPFIKAMGFGGMIGTREYVFTDQPGTCEGANFISDLNDYLSQNGISKTGDVADYEHAKAALAKLQTAQDAYAAVAKQEDVIAKAQADLNQQQKQLKQDQAHLQQLQKAASDSKQTAAQKQAAVEKAQAAVNNDKKNIAQTNSQLTTAKGELTQAQAKLAQLQQSLTGQTGTVDHHDGQNAGDQGTVATGTDAVTGPTTATAAASQVLPAAPARLSAASVTKLSTATAQRSVANATKLPQTGTQDSAAVMVLGALTTMLGLGLAAKKREF